MPGGRGDPGDAVGARSSGGLDGEAVPGCQVGAVGQVPVHDEVLGLGGWCPGCQGIGGQRGGVPGVPVRGPVGGGGSRRQGLCQEGEFGDDPLDAREVADPSRGVLGQPGPLGDGFGLVLDLGLALLVLDRRLVDVLVGGDDYGRGRVPLGADGAAQTGLQKGAAGRDEGGSAHEGEKGTEEPPLRSRTVCSA